MNLGCLGCPCAAQCATKPAGLSGIGACSCVGCSKAATCTKARTKAPQTLGTLGLIFDSPDSTGGIDFTDWKTWAIAALAAVLFYNLFFREEQRTGRKRKREAFAAERTRYQANMKRIRESA